MAVASHRFASLRELMQGAAFEMVKATGSTAALTPLWNEAVGPSIAKNAAPTALYGDVLVVECSSAQWVDALAARHAEIVARLPSSLGVRSLRLALRTAPP
jgi:predicted nucleic acid-binding Zn ribbon protein